MSAARTHLPLYASREDQARAEIGVTEARPAVAALLVAAFVTLLVAGMAATLVPRALRAELAAPCGGLATSLRTAMASQDGASPLARFLAPNRVLRERIGAFEDVLDERFPAAVALRTPVQTLLAALGAGDEQVLLGRDGWLYYRPDVTALTGPGIPAGRPGRDAESPASVRAVVQLQRYLERHGIRLVLLPTPSKPGVHPEGLVPHASADALAATAAVTRVRGLAAWRDGLEPAGIDVFDASPAMASARGAGEPAYLRSDTHWRPEAMDAVAVALAAVVRAVDVPAATPPREGPPSQVSNVGDTAAMLALDASHVLRAPETVTIRPVADACSETASIVLLGDSFSNIYSLGAMGWGESAGLAERLALHAGEPVRPFVRNDGGAWASRERFAQALARGEAALAGVRVVVWQFAERELVHGDWRPIDWPEPRDRPSSIPADPIPGTEVLTLAGRIASVSDGPRRDAPYADFIVKLHVVELTDPHGVLLEAPREMVVSTFGMRRREVLPAASLRPGARVRFAARSWESVASEHGKLNAGTLDDPMLELDLPLFWADTVEAIP